MSEHDAHPPIDPGLLERFRRAGTEIRWRPAPTASARRGKARVAHLHDEEARVEERGRHPGGRVVVDSGPVGALVLVLEIDRRGPPSGLGAAEAGNEPGFRHGALVAAWDGKPVPHDSRPTQRDLVELARYALV